MGPVKFDDIPKVATEVLNDDYQVSGYVLKTKQKTSWAGSVFSSQVDLFASDKCSTPAKLTWKLPQPFGCTAFNIDKLEMDKGGQFKLEASSDKAHKDVKLECKSDLADISKITAVCTFTGLKDARVMFECKATNPQDFSAEATYAMGAAVAGLKFTPKGALPDFGLYFKHGPMFCSLMAKEQLGAFGATGFYKVSDDLKVATAFDLPSKGAPKMVVGLTYRGLYKVKVSQDQSVCCSVKHHLEKGFTLLGGAKYDVVKGAFSYGCQLSIE